MVTPQNAVISNHCAVPEAGGTLRESLVALVLHKGGEAENGTRSGKGGQTPCEIPSRQPGVRLSL